MAQHYASDLPYPMPREKRKPSPVGGAPIKPLDTSAEDMFRRINPGR